MAAQVSKLIAQLKRENPSLQDSDLLDQIEAAAGDAEPDADDAAPEDDAGDAPDFGADDEAGAEQPGPDSDEPADDESDEDAFPPPKASKGAPKGKRPMPKMSSTKPFM